MGPAAPNALGSPRDQRDFGVVARLAARVSLETADAELRAIAKGLEARYPEQREWSAGVSSYRSTTRELPVSLSIALLGAVGFVLLIVCANIAGLLLARGVDRRREIAIRAALGASRGRIVRHLLAESLVLSLAGGALGLVVALWGVELAGAVGVTPPFYVEIGVNRASVIFCAGSSILAGLLFGLLPALRSSSTDVQTALKDGATTVRKSALRGALVVGERALDGAARRCRPDDEELRPHQRSRAGLRRAASHHRESGVQRRQIPRATAPHRRPAALGGGARPIAGAMSAALERVDFLAGFGRSDRSIVAEGVSSTPAGASPRFYHVVSPGYFTTIKLPIVAGRSFTDADRDGAERVVIINRRMAEMLWPRSTALGRHIKLGPVDSLPWLTVVGIAGDVRGGDREGSQLRNYAYVPMAQAPGEVPRSWCALPTPNRA